jgi:hypothetical protein
MKKVKFLTIIAVAFAVVFLMSGIAQANFAIHGGYLADTDACAGCHRAHTATSAVTWIDNAGSRRSALLVGPPTTQVYIFCYVCHCSGAPGAATDVEGGVLDSTSPGGAVEGANAFDMSAINKVLNGGGFELTGNDRSRPVTSTHEVKGAAWQAWGADENIAGYIFMDCCSCHDPHGSSNYRILKDYVNGHWVGGYEATLTPSTSATGQAATIPGVDPDPLPFVISNERGYPLKGSPVPAGTPSGIGPSAMMAAPTHGFRLHRQYNNGDLIPNNYNNNYEYLPSYTIARYGRGEVPHVAPNATDPNRGMSAWCCACHENYMARTSISRWTLDGIGKPGSPGNYPLGAGTTSTLTTILRDTDAPETAGITADELHITVLDATGFPDPNRAYVKYIGIYHPTAQQVVTEEGIIGIPRFEMVAYNDITPNLAGTPVTFIVPPAGRGAFDTAQQAFPNNFNGVDTKVYLGYDASDGYGDLVRHRHPMNVPFTVWQNAKYNPTFVAGDRALVLSPSDWQAFDNTIPVVDIPLDHNAGYPPADALSEQNSQQANIVAGTENHYNIDDWIECLTCHRAHGTSATMSGFAGATMMPASIEGFNTLVPNPGQDDGVPPTGDSALLRADNRGVCERCHNK